MFSLLPLARYFERSLQIPDEGRSYAIVDDKLFDKRVPDDLILQLLEGGNLLLNRSGIPYLRQRCRQLRSSHLVIIVGRAWLELGRQWRKGRELKYRYYTSQKKTSWD